MHVAASFKRPPDGAFDQAGDVRVRGNTIALVPPFDQKSAPRGVFVDNAIVPSGAIPGGLWAVEDNVASGARVAVNAPTFVRQTGNVA